MKNLIDEIFPKPQDLIKEVFFGTEDEINKMLLEAAEAQKEEVLPNINKCQKCGELLPKGQEGTKCMNCLL